MYKTDLGAYGGDNTPKSVNFMDLFGKIPKTFWQLYIDPKSEEKEGGRGVYKHQNTSESIKMCSKNPKQS